MQGAGGNIVKLLTWSVRGLGGQIKRSKVFSHLKNLSTDIAFFYKRLILK